MSFEDIPTPRTDAATTWREKAGSNEREYLVPVEVSKALERELEVALNDVGMLHDAHDGAVREAYRLLGIEDDGELRWKWVMLELSKLPALKAKVLTLVEDLASYAPIFAGDIDSRGPSQREAIVSELRVKHIIQPEEIIALLSRS